MLPAKWKIYKIANYFLLCCGIIIFVFILRMIINAPGTEFLFLSLLFSLPFLFLCIHTLINLAIMTKTFPDKMIAGNNYRWHVLSLVLNMLSIIGLLIMFFSLLIEMNKSYFDGLLIMFLIAAVLLLTSVFILVCQLSVKKYLQLKSMSLMNSLIDSIGNNAKDPK